MDRKSEVRSQTSEVRRRGRKKRLTSDVVPLTPTFGVRLPPNPYTLFPTLLLTCLFLLGSFALSPAAIKVGADVLIENRLDLVKGKHVGLITNQTGRLSTGEYLVDALRSKGVHVVALFGPEHGIRGLAQAGDDVKNEIDSATGIPIYSLYGPSTKITRNMLKGIDLLVYDIQGLSVRFYTYISTMGLAMEAAAEAGIPILVLDRPDPLGGLLVDGPIMQDSLRSFVGMYPVPVVYGLTCGELARMINGEGWLSKKACANLTVVPMEGWKRGMPWSEIGLRWYPPSPNIPTPAAADIYPATCYVEGTNLSEGRGTSKPFSQFGAPFLDAHAMAAALDSLALPGVRFGTTSFTPSSSKLDGKQCEGVTAEVTDLVAYKPVEVGLHIVNLLARWYPKECVFNRQFLCRLFGNPGVLDVVDGGKSVGEVVRGWEKERDSFVEEAKRYKLY
jgi:uncharacterized protein YbbC (DUF1343 family)